MLLFHYDVNFLFVQSLYARNNMQQKSVWKMKMRDKFRDDNRGWLQESFNFFAMKAKPGVDGQTFIEQNFEKVTGKLYTPFLEEDIYSLALDISDPEHNNESLMQDLEQFFFIAPCPLGTDPKKVLQSTPTDIKIEPNDNELVLCVTSERINFDNIVALMLEKGKLGIALQMTGATLQLVEGFTKAKYVLIHNKGDRQELFYCNGKGPKLISGTDCKDIAVTKKNEALYLVYEVDTVVRPEIGKSNLSEITKIPSQSSNPQLLPLERLRKK